MDSSQKTSHASSRTTSPTKRRTSSVASSNRYIDIIGGYLHPVLSYKASSKKIKTIIGHLRRYEEEFNGIAFCGLSGALIAPVVAHKLKKEILAVRKNETRHSGLHVEGVLDGPYIILDDFVATGRTLEYIKERIELEAKKRNKHPKLVGVVLYNEHVLHHTLRDFINTNKVWVIHID